MKTLARISVTLIAVSALGLACEDAGQNNGEEETAANQTPPAAGNQPSHQGTPGQPAPVGQTPRPIAVALTQAQLPICDSLNQGNAVYVQDQGGFQWCNTGSWGALDMRGEAGPPGPQGPAGPTGPAGADGENLSDARNVYDRNGNQVGKILFGTDSQFTMRLSDNSVLTIDLATGTFPCGSVSNPNSSNGCSCIYTSADCSGTCYVNRRTHGSKIITGHSSLHQLIGTESEQSNLAVTTYYRPQDDSCGTSVGVISTAYPTSSYSLPSGLSLPFATPLRFAP